MKKSFLVFAGFCTLFCTVTSRVDAISVPPPSLDKPESYITKTFQKIAGIFSSRKVTGAKLFGTPEAEEGADVAIDENGGIYVVVRRSGGEGSGPDARSTIVKYSANLEEIWHVDTLFACPLNAITIDLAQNPVVSGTTWQEVTGGPTGFGWSPSGSCVMRYSGSDHRLMIEQLYSPFDINDLSLNRSDGSIYAVGTYGCGAADHPEDPMCSRVMKFDRGELESHRDVNLHPSWPMRLRSTYLETPTEPADNSVIDATVGPDGLVYVTGITWGLITPDNEYYGWSDAYLAIFDGDLNRLAIKEFGTYSGDGGESVLLDNGGNIFVVGRGNLTFNMPECTFEAAPGLPECRSRPDGLFVARFRFEDGEIRQVGPVAEFFATHSDPIIRDHGIYASLTPVASVIDNQGKLYIVGWTGGYLVPEEERSEMLGGWDAFIMKLGLNRRTGEMEMRWFRRFGTDRDDIANGAAISRNGEIVVTGRTDGNMGGNTNRGRSDAFVVKFDRNGEEL